MADIEKLNFPEHSDYQVDHTVPADQKFSASELNQIAGKIDEIIELINEGGAGGSTLFESNIPINMNSTGRFGKWKNGDIIPAIGKNANQVVIESVTEAIPPTYNSPTADMGGTAVTNIEYGQSIENLNVYGIFNKNDGGNATGHRIYKAGTKVADDLNFTENVVFGTSAIVYGYEADYGQGAIKNDNLGNPSPIPGTRNGVPPGITNRATRTFTPRMKRFYGAGPAGLTTETFRNLPNSAFDNTANSWIMATGTQYKDFYILVPTTRTITSIIDTNIGPSADILNSFNVSTVNVPDAGGNNRQYKLYKLTNEEAFGASHNLQITTTP